MRKWILSGLCALLWCLPAWGMAVTADVPVPPEALAFFEGDAYYADARIISWLTPARSMELQEQTGDDAPFSDAAFALLRWDSQADIHCFQKTAQGWVWRANLPFSLTALAEKWELGPEAAPAITVALQDGKEILPDLIIHAAYGPALYADYAIERRGDGIWRLWYVETSSWSILPDDEAGRCDFIPEDGLTVTRSTAFLTAFGQIGDLAQIPLSPEEAAPLAPTMLIGQKGVFPANQRYPVYEGPNPDHDDRRLTYPRAGKGKAMVSTNGAITVYGSWQGSLLISYGLSDQQERFGWLRAEDLPADTLSVYEPLCFQPDGQNYLYGVVTQTAAKTDDPRGRGLSTGFIGSGASVRVLAQEPDSGYYLVEGRQNGAFWMGFLRPRIIDRSHGFVQHATRRIDRAVTFSEAEIHAAMDAVAAYIYDSFPGCVLKALRYVDAENADPTAWWVSTETGYRSMKLFSDLESMPLWDLESSGSDYEWILYRAPSEGWHVGNYGYE
ncbi:MAG: hypothetical protein IJ662_13275 [Clostridia bacterium]|nr:hypothetical protein [Clostridia bacterium]